MNEIRKRDGNVMLCLYPRATHFCHTLFISFNLATPHLNVSFAISVHLDSHIKVDRAQTKRPKKHASCGDNNGLLHIKSVLRPFSDLDGLHGCCGAYVCACNICSPRFVGSVMALSIVLRIDPHPRLEWCAAAWQFTFDVSLASFGGQVSPFFISANGELARSRGKLRAVWEYVFLATQSERLELIDRIAKRHINWMRAYWEYLG